MDSILAFALGKPKVMWLDCSANFQRFSYPDSIRFYVDKCHEAGITHLVLDIKDNTGEVLYPSKYAAQKKNWKNFDRPDFDFIGTFIEAAHARNMIIFAGMNIFADGQNIVKRGAIFDKHKKWQAINYVPRKGLLPVTEIEGKPTMFLNPALKEVQKYEIDVIKEVVRNYAFDGIMLDVHDMIVLIRTFLLNQRRCLRNSSERKLRSFRRIFLNGALMPKEA